MVLKSWIAVIVVATVLTGCAGAFKKPDPAADYGLPPLNYEQATKDYFHEILKDPYSAKYRFEAPQKAYMNTGLAYGGGVKWQGWLVDVRINAKNSFGGYIGEKPYMILFRGENVFKHIKGRKHVLLHRVE